MPDGCWPALMRAETAAAYVNEVSVEAFLGRVGSVYPEPRIIEGRGRVWLKTEMDRAAAAIDGSGAMIRDAADVL